MDSKIRYIIFIKSGCGGHTNKQWLCINICQNNASGPVRNIGRLDWHKCQRHTEQITWKHENKVDFFAKMVKKFKYLVMYSVTLC